MARRNIEAAIQASQELELEGKLLPCKIPSSYSKLESYKVISSQQELDGVYSLQYSPDGSMLAVGTGNEAMRLYDTASGKHIEDLRQPRYGGFPVKSLRWHPYDHHILYGATCNGMIYALNVKSHTCTAVVSERKNEINCLDFSADGSTFATAGKDLAVRIYDTKTCKEIKCYEGYSNATPAEDTEVQGHGMRVFALKHSPDNSHILLSGGWDNHIKVWDIRTSDGVKRTIAGPHICGDALDLKGLRILTGSWVGENSLQLWDYTSGNLIKNIPFPSGHDGEYLYAAQFCENDTVVAGGSGTKSIKAINSTTCEVLGEIELNGKCVNTLDTTRGGQLVAVGGMINSVTIGVIS
ncbi:hypothetical protein EB796_012050 [Bugula neritina]|uniref:Anaphase-promoting complex subunit 4-like WD40 domain-containing protein n=1 Tax=Bugula neritina TaxID=10212 RepID=A0A7J7JVA6_BUGNE|nr:hypothetical protein EB796_012050 [Bugula neritina]